MMRLGVNIVLMRSKDTEMATERQFASVCNDRISVALGVFRGSLIGYPYDLGITCQCFHGVSACWSVVRAWFDQSHYSSQMIK
mmetsp:Transcript_25763/g.54205  ORF Transcript_25763/g.54205 Transcript_25763/m.54205 type:complete len:83 (+) Transcript_25763:531-779(+)